MLTEVKCGCPAWFGLLQLHLLLGTKGVLAALGGGNSTKVPGTDISRLELICSEFSDAFEKPGTPPERAIKDKTTVLLGSVLHAKR